MSYRLTYSELCSHSSKKDLAICFPDIYSLLTAYSDCAIQNFNSSTSRGTSFNVKTVFRFSLPSVITILN